MILIDQLIFSIVWRHRDVSTRAALYYVLNYFFMMKMVGKRSHGKDDIIKDILSILFSIECPCCYICSLF